MTRLYLHPLDSSRGRALRIHNADVHCFTYGFHHHSFRLRWSILVVEPSPLFRDRSLAADCPISLFSNHSRLPFPTTLWEESSKGFPAIHPIIISSRYQLGRLCLSLLKQLKHNLRHGYEIPQQLSFQKMFLSY